MSYPKYKCGIIGIGRLGKSLAGALLEIDSLLWVCDRDIDKIKEFEGIVPCFSNIESIREIPDILFICCPDNLIINVAEQLAGHFKESLKGKTVVHCSGINSHAILSVCSEYGANIVKAHPYQTFYYSDKNCFKGISWGVSKHSSDGRIHSLIKQLGGKAHELEDDIPDIEAYYHASAVFCSNFLNTLLAASKDLLQKVQLPNEEFIKPIISKTIDNNFKANDSRDFPLTGPIARLDKNVIEMHLLALRSDLHIYKSYCYLSLATIETAYSKGLFDVQQYSEIKAYFEKKLEETNIQS